MDELHAGLITAVADWRRESRICAADLETLLPYLAPRSTEAEAFLLPQRLREQVEASPTEPQALQLHPDLLDRIEADTALAAKSLRQTFSPEPPAPSTGTPVTADGLRAEHHRVLIALATRPSWTTAEVTALCNEHGLRLAGALDVLNECAYDLCGEPLLEPTQNADSTQPLAINHDVLKEMLQ